jgi:hypothetical protein
LRGLPIKELSVMACRNLRDYTPILDLPQLEKLELDSFPEQLLPLRERANLKFIRAAAYPGDPASNTLRPPADFWQVYDAHRK